MKLHHPDISSVSFNGQTYEADERGVFDVPDGAAAELAPFGLKPWKEPIPQAPTPPSKPVAQWSNDDLKAKASELGLQLAEDIKRPELIQAVSEALKGQE